MPQVRPPSRLRSSGLSAAQQIMSATCEPSRHTIRQSQPAGTLQERASQGGISSDASSVACPSATAVRSEA
eukprot:3885300-Prymnesium_polylepis.1